MQTAAPKAPTTIARNEELMIVETAYFSYIQQFTNILRHVFFTHFPQHHSKSNRHIE